MRDYPKVGGSQEKPGYRVPSSFLNKSIQMAKRLSDNRLYKSFKHNFKFKSSFDFGRFQKYKGQK